MPRLQDNEEAVVQIAGLLVDNRASPTVDRNNAARVGIDLYTNSHMLDGDNPDRAMVSATNDEFTKELFGIPDEDNIRDYPNLRAIASELNSPGGKIQYGLNGSGLMLCTTTVDRDYVTETGTRSRKPFIARYVTRIPDNIMDDYAERTLARQEAQTLSTAR